MYKLALRPVERGLERGDLRRGEGELLLQALHLLLQCLAVGPGAVGGLGLCLELLERLLRRGLLLSGAPELLLQRLDFLFGLLVGLAVLCPFGVGGVVGGLGDGPGLLALQALPLGLHGLGDGLLVPLDGHVPRAGLDLLDLPLHAQDGLLGLPAGVFGGLAVIFSIAAGDFRSLAGIFGLPAGNFRGVAGLRRLVKRGLRVVQLDGVGLFQSFLLGLDLRRPLPDARLQLADGDGLRPDLGGEVLPLTFRHGKQGQSLGNRQIRKRLRICFRPEETELRGGIAVENLHVILGRAL